MKLKHWVWLQIALGVIDIVTTPWHNLALEANPIIRTYGILPMLAFKVIGIWLLTVWWKMYDNQGWRLWVAVPGTAPVLVAVACNIVAISGG